jgi:hypothetical protein
MRTRWHAVFILSDLRFAPVGSRNEIGSFTTYEYEFSVCGAAALPANLSGVRNFPVSES